MRVQPIGGRTTAASSVLLTSAGRPKRIAACHAGDLGFEEMRHDDVEPAQRAERRPHLL
jgi:hypothetical protein